MAERRSTRALRSAAVVPALILLGGGHLVLGGLMAAAPETFFDSFADYGVRNDHYIRDLSTFYLALGAVQLVAAGRSAWRVPVLSFTAAEYVLHVVNHTVDVGEADPAWVGPANLISLAAVMVVVVVLLRASRRADR